MSFIDAGNHIGLLYSNNCRTYVMKAFTSIPRSLEVKQQNTSLIHVDHKVKVIEGCYHNVGWRRGVVVTALVASTKLLYVEPG